MGWCISAFVTCVAARHGLSLARRDTMHHDTRCNWLVGQCRYTPPPGNHTQFCCIWGRVVYSILLQCATWYTLPSRNTENCVISWWWCIFSLPPSMATDLYIYTYTSLYTHIYIYIYIYILPQPFWPIVHRGAMAEIAQKRAKTERKEQKQTNYHHQCPRSL